MIVLFFFLISTHFIQVLFKSTTYASQLFNAKQQNPKTPYFKVKNLIIFVVKKKWETVLVIVLQKEMEKVSRKSLLSISSIIPLEQPTVKNWQQLIKMRMSLKLSMELKLVERANKF